MTRPVRGIRVGCWATILAIGCSQSSNSNPNPVPVGAQDQALVNVGLAYREASVSLQRGPANESELRTHLKKFGDPDKLLVSPNDGERYHINWGLTPLRPSALGQRFLLYEKTGKDGKRYALDIMLKVRHLSADEIANLQGSQ